VRDRGRDSKGGEGEGKTERVKEGEAARGEKDGEKPGREGEKEWETEGKETEGRAESGETSGRDRRERLMMRMWRKKKKARHRTEKRQSEKHRVRHRVEKTQNGEAEEETK
jgi:hypothetical protein